MKPTILDAILALKPDAVVSISGDEITWHEASSISNDEILTKLQELLNQYDANEYQRKRAKEYPPMQDYLDGVVKNDKQQIEQYIAKCIAVKNKYPKP